MSDDETKSQINNGSSGSGDTKKQQQGSCGIPALTSTQNYTDWREKVDIWRRVTNVSKENQALQLILFGIKDKAAYKVAKKHKLDDIHNEGGLDVILKDLDARFALKEPKKKKTGMDKIDNYEKKQL